MQRQVRSPIDGTWEKNDALCQEICENFTNAFRNKEDAESFVEEVGRFCDEIELGFGCLRFYPKDLSSLLPTFLSILSVTEPDEMVIESPLPQDCPKYFSPALCGSLLQSPEVCISCWWD